MTPEAPEVSVIIPTRDRIGFVRQAVRDALRQQDVELEVVVVDDASQDAGEVARLADLDPRVRVVRHERPGGVARARNTGVANARGRWLAFLDDDDRWGPEKLSTQLRTAAEHGASWVYAGALTIDERERILAVTPPYEAGVLADGLEAANPVPGGCSNVIVRADLLREVGGFDEELSLLADWDLWIRLAQRERPATCEELLIGYRLHRENLHVRHVATVGDEVAVMARKFGVRTPGAAVSPDLLLWHASAHRRAGSRRRAAALYLRRWRMTRKPRDLVRVASALLGEGALSVVRMHRARRRAERPAWLDR